ncbi:MAG: LysM peptidoglycan-binding domain-containing protein [Muribaculaceae bacterium]
MRRNLFTLLLCSATIIASAAPTILTIKGSISDDAIVYPESFETDTQELMKNWYLQNYTALDENVDNKPSKDVSDAEYIKRLKTIPSIIEMPYNQIVRNYINMYTQKRRSLVESMLGMSLYYMPIFEQALEKEGLPLELKYLPVIESALNPDAVSRAGATGLWQFMLGTAKGLGLEVNTLVDERRDPYRASAKAATYLKSLHGIYGDWSLAIAAYNCGPGNVNKALRRAGGTQKDFWAIYPFLPAETRGYVPAFIAANYVMTYFKSHNISPALAKRPLITDTVHVTKRVHLRQISEVLNIPMEEIQVLNPHFRQDIIPGDIRPYSLSLPSQQICSYVMSEDSIISHNANLYARRDVVEPSSYNVSSNNNDSELKLVVKYHRVGRGESITKVARKYGVSVSNIKKWNRLRRNSLRRGQTLKINTYKRVSAPVEEEENVEETVDNRQLAQAKVRNQEESVDNNTEEEVVEEEVIETPVKNRHRKTTEKAEPQKSKKSNQSIEKEEKSSKSKSIEKKKKKRDDEKTDKRKDKKKKKERNSRAKSHTVKSGESLARIADKYPGVTVSELKKANNITGSKIKPGQKIKIPKQ